MKNKGILCVIGLMLLASCYKAGNPMPDNSAPKYNIYGFNSFVPDTVFNGNIFINDSTVLPFDFQLISGNPANYPFVAYLTGVPPDITISPDTINFRLNYKCQFKLHAYSQADTGSYIVYLNVVSSLYGNQKYPVNFKVSQE